MDPNGSLMVKPSGRRCVELRLLGEGVEVGLEDIEPLMLPWDAYGRIRWVLDGPPADGWAVSQWTTGRGGWSGVALRVSGHFEAAAHPLFAATDSAWRRFSRWFESGALTGDLLPILPTTTMFATHTRERDTLDALATVLSARRDARCRLADAGCMTRLAADLSAGVLAAPVERIGAHRDTTDIIVALRQAGFVHRFGRPLSRGEMATPDEIVSATRTRLDANRYRQGRHVDDATILAVARRVYLDVEPCAFAALA